MECQVLFTLKRKKCSRLSSAAVVIGMIQKLTSSAQYDLVTHSVYCIQVSSIVCTITDLVLKMSSGPVA